ncbi:WS/DGAT domain-containing protein [Streptomyces sp. NBC_01754]|uniref:WS/DGAT domain-containing protein n=1 Tax=Streptomyces sp. NBC_01754 TaxID=2975930 RepID=UPI002DDAB346|nr:WS/DGAT domain-containing protein [Streptomyces sp. NBC_01754]WSC91230.1 WS/DGAT domain-containing protein [Streptomyces sp. NBC_01754]
MRSGTTAAAQVGDAVLMAMAPLEHAAQLYISAALVLEGDVPEAGAVADHIGRRLHRVPGLWHRYAERGGRPGWQPQEVRADDHVAPLRLDLRPGESGLDALMREVRLLPPVGPAGGPMWDVLVATGFAAGRWALVFRVHHTQMDGGAITHTLDQLFGHSPASRRRTLFSDAVRPGFRHIPSAAASVLGAARPTSPWPARVSAVRPGSATYAVTGPVDVADLGVPGGSTVSQVLAAAFALAADAWWPLPGDRRVHALVPMDMREPGEQRTLGNHFAPLRLALPTGPPDRVLREVTAQMRAWRRPGFRAALDVTIRRTTPFRAGFLLGGRISSGTCCRAVVSSIRSRHPLSFAGAPVLDLVPAVPTYPGHALSCTLWSYGGRARVAFGAHTSMPSVGTLPGLWDQALRAIRAESPYV